MASLQAFLSFPTRATHVLSRTQIPPSPFNACHGGYDLVLGVLGDFVRRVLYIFEAD